MIFFLLEEESMKLTLKNLLVKIVHDEPYKLISHNGKMDLQASIPKIVPTLSKNINAKIVIVQDQDYHDCIDLKTKLLDLSQNAHCSILIRIACKELESWFLGDMKAIGKAFPKFKPDKYFNKKKFRNIDDIQKPSMILKKIIPELRKYEIIPKRKLAESISVHMDLHDNKSLSFIRFISGLKKLRNK